MIRRSDAFNTAIKSSLLSVEVRNGPTKSRPDAPGAVPTPPVIQLLNVQKGINRTLLHAQCLHFITYKMNMENEINNVTSCYAETYTTILLQNVAPL